MSDTRLRIHSLDALRGFAAMAVVFWHWQHFLVLGTSKLTWPPISGPVDHSIEPLYIIFRLFYEHGFVAVDMFFIISGFIFFRLYQVKLAEKKLSMIDFGIFRFSRLYPLHFATLITVAILQIVFFKISGQYFIYPQNNIKKFLESLIFIQKSGNGAAFNGPEWSLTIEIMMYILFCLLARFGMLRNAIVPAILIAAGLLLHRGHNSVTRGLCGFFVGGILYQIFEVARKFGYDRLCFFCALIVSIVGFSLIVIDVYSNGDISTYLSNFIPISKHYILGLIVFYVLFPSIVLMIVFHEVLFEARYDALSWLGEISYSSYLLHFPLQLSISLIVLSGVLKPEAVRSVFGMIIYFGLLIPLSLLVYRRFEVPMQNALRSRWAGSAVARTQRPA